MRTLYLYVDVLMKIVAGIVGMKNIYYVFQPHGDK